MATVSPKATAMEMTVGARGGLTVMADPQPKMTKMADPRSSAARRR